MFNIIFDVNNNIFVWNNFFNNNYCLIMGLYLICENFILNCLKKIIKINIVIKGYIIINIL